MASRPTNNYDHTRGLGFHSYGMEHSMATYIDGLNAADERAKTEAADILAEGAIVNGEFGEITINKYNRMDRQGLRAFSAYSASISETGTVDTYELRSHRMPHFIYHTQNGDDRLVGYIHLNNNSWGARKTNIGSHSLSCVEVTFDNADDAMRYIVLSHMKQA